MYSASLSTYKCMHGSKKDYSNRFSLYPGFFRLLSLQNSLFFNVSEASPTSKEFCNKGEAFHPQKELQLSRLVHRKTEQLQQEQTLSHRGNSSSNAVCYIHQMTRFALGFSFCF